MKVLDVTEVKLEWSDLRTMTRHPEPEPSRSAGVHVSGVLKYVAKELAMFTAEDQDDEMPLRILLGLAFEEMAARLYPEMHWQPGEISRDGVIGSPDGLSYLPEYGFMCVDEFKFTGKSQRVKGGKDGELKDIRSEWLWMQQCQSYLNLYRGHGVEMRHARLHICWKYGVYGEWPLTERYYRYLVEYEEAELDRNWAMMIKYKGAVEPEGREL